MLVIIHEFSVFNLKVNISLLLLISKCCYIYRYLYVTPRFLIFAKITIFDENVGPFLNYYLNFWFVLENFTFFQELLGLLA